MKKMWMVMVAMIVVGLVASVSTVQVQAACDDETCICGACADGDCDGICDLCGECIPEGDGDPDQIRAKDGSGDGEPKGDGECDGDGEPDQIQKKDGTGKTE